MKNQLIPGRPYSHAYKSSHLKAIQKLKESSTIEADATRIFSREHTAREEYKKFISQLPKFKGVIIIFGLDHRNKDIILSVFEGTTNLNEEFRSPLRKKDILISRRDWIHEKMIQYNLKKIFICPAQKIIIEEPDL